MQLCVQKVGLLTDATASPGASRSGTHITVASADAS
jgi:hypothetical protein